jgi:hypothetical protein
MPSNYVTQDYLADSTQGSGILEHMRVWWTWMWAVESRCGPSESGSGHAQWMWPQRRVPSLSNVATASLLASRVYRPPARPIELPPY